jgi:Ca-activated chloride channel family protein
MFVPDCALNLATSRLSAVRKPLFKLLPLFLIVFLLITPETTAQDRPGDGDVIRVSTDLLLFPVRIRDKKGLAVSGLTTNDLKLKDDDEVTSGITFTAGADRVALMFALDQSGSLRQLISQQQETAISLFERFGDRSTIAILRFAETPVLAVPFQREVTQAKAGFVFHAAPNARTAIFDAAAKAIEAFQKLPPVRAERRIVILISDGLDNASSISAAKVINAANEHYVSFYVIHLPLFEPQGDRLGVRPPSKGFRELAEKTGGKYFLAGDRRTALTTQTTDLTPIFQAIEDDLRSQYLLGFYIKESAKDGRKHLFSVSLVPPDIQYSVRQRGYARKHEFFINLKPGSTTLPR